MVADNVKTFGNLSNFKYDKMIVFVVSVLVMTLIADTLIAKYSIFSESAYNLDVDIFIIISVIFVTGQYLILEFIKYKSKAIPNKERLHLGAIHQGVTITQHIITAIFVFLIFQILLTSQYNTGIVISAISMSYSLALIIMGLLSYQFFSWFQSNRNHTVLLYGLSSVSLSVNVALTLVLAYTLSLDLPTEIQPHVGVFRPNVISGSENEILSNAYFSSSIFSFLITWVATATLLRHYSKKIGKLIYWIIIGIPLAYFLSQFTTLFLDSIPPLILDAVSFSILLTLVFSLSKPIGGILFGIAFWDTARKIRQGTIRDYMLISAYGLMLFFISNQAAIILPVIPYPPFGLATTIFTGLSSYLILVGIYSSAVSLSQGMSLRQSIRKLALEQSKLIDSIGSAQMEHDIQNKIMSVLKGTQDKMTAETGVKSSLNEDDMKQYLEDVLQEIKDKKGQKREKL